MLGVNWVYAPVADVNTDMRNPVIGVRSFGDGESWAILHLEREDIEERKRESTSSDELTFAASQIPSK